MAKTESATDPTGVAARRFRPSRLALYVLLAMAALAAGRAAKPDDPRSPSSMPSWEERVSSPSHRLDPAVWACDAEHVDLNHKRSHWLDYSRLEMISMVTLRYLPSYREGFGASELVVRFSFNPTEPRPNDPPWCVPAYNMKAFSDALLEVILGEGTVDELTLKLSGALWNVSGFYEGPAGRGPPRLAAKADLVSRGDWHVLKL